MALYLLPPDVARKDFKGHPGFQDSIPGVRGSGVAGYAQKPGYHGYDTPTKVGARYFAPQPKFDELTDQPIPIATGNKWDGGAEPYRTRVYNAAKKNRQSLGFSQEDIDDLKPRKVA